MAPPRPFPARASRRVALLLASALPLLADDNNKNNDNPGPPPHQHHHQHQQQLWSNHQRHAAADDDESSRTEERKQPHHHKNISSSASAAAAASLPEERQTKRRGRIRRQQESDYYEQCYGENETSEFRYFTAADRARWSTTPVPPYAPQQQLEEDDAVPWLWSGGANDDLRFLTMRNKQCWKKKKNNDSDKKVGDIMDFTAWRMDINTTMITTSNDGTDNGMCPLLTNHSTIKSEVEGSVAAAGADEKKKDEVLESEEGTASEEEEERAAKMNATTASEETTTTAPTPSSSSSSAASTILSVDYASKSAGALVLDKSSEFSGTSNLLTNDKDRYAIVPCSEPKKHVVIGLSEDLLVKRVVLAAYERYSSHVETFQLLGSSASTKATDDDIILNASDDLQQQQQQAMSVGGGSGVWVDLGTYKAQFMQQGEQVFDLEKPAWARYLQFRFLSFYGDEHYCTLSQVKVHGSTVLQGFHEQWTQQEQEEETNNKSNDEGEEEAVANMGGEAEEGTAPMEDSTVDGTTKETEAGEEGGLETDELNEGGSDVDTEDEPPSKKGVPITTDSATATAAAASNACGGGLLAECVAGGNLDFESLMLLYSSSGSACLSPECASSAYSNFGISSSSQSINPDYYMKTLAKDPTGPSFTVNDIVESLPTTTKLTAPIIEKIQHIIQRAGLDDKLEDIKNRFLASTADGEQSDKIDTVDETSGRSTVGIDLDDSVNEKKKEISTKVGDDKDSAPPPNAQQEAHLLQPQQGQPQGQGQPQKTEAVAGASSDESSEAAPPTVAAKSTTAPPLPVPSPPSSSSTTGTPAIHPSTKDESIRRTSDKLAQLLERLPSAACLEKLDFDALVNQKVNRNNKNVGQGLGNPAAMMGGAVEPVFKKLTDEIKALQASVAVHDQFTRETVVCYQRVLFDLLLEMESIRIEHGARLDKLETGREHFAGVLRQLCAMKDWLLPRILCVLSALWNFIALVVAKDLGVFICVAVFIVAVLVIASIYHVLERLLFYKKQQHNREESSISCLPSSPPPSPPPELNIKKPTTTRNFSDDDHNKVALTVATVVSCDATSDDGSLLSEEKPCHDSEPKENDSSYIPSSVIKPRRTKVKLLKKTSPRNKNKEKRRS